MSTRPLKYKSVRARSASEQRDSSRESAFSSEVTAAPATPLSVGISLVLPMYEESAVVDKTIPDVLRKLERGFADFEVIVVDDGSADDCAEKVQRWTEKDARIRLIRMQRNERFGGALRKGLTAATRDWIFYTDFDLPVDLACFPAIWKELQHTDVVTGFSPELQKNLTRRARLLSRGYNGLVRATFGLPLRDVNFGFKAMHKEVYDRLHLISRSPFVDAELFIKAQRQGYTIREVPVPFARRQAGVSKIRRLNVIVWSLFDLARTRLHTGRRSATIQSRGGKETGLVR